MNIIRYRYLFLGFSGILVLASIAALAVWGLPLGLDFTGGTAMEVEFLTPIGRDARPPIDAIHTALDPLRLGDISVQPSGSAGVVLRLRYVDEPTYRNILTALRGAAGKYGMTVAPEKPPDATSPVIGADLYRRSLIALSLAIAVIVLYIAWAFRRISKPIASWKYGVVAVVALAHDLAIPAGIFAALGYFKGVEIDILFITALLTILGFSVHDTIVVFDRIRENLRTPHESEPYAATVNRSIRETFVRSVLTSLTVLLVLTIVFFLGGASTQYFALALIIGITAGTYSSLFVASPLLVLWNNLSDRNSSSLTKQK